MIASLLAALRARPGYAALVERDLVSLPATGTAHGHVRLPDGLLARIAYAHEGDPAAAARLATQAAAFRHLAPAGRTPRLHAVIEPRAGLPGGALIVDYVDGHAPDLPSELAALADTLARLHGLPLPEPGSPIPRQRNPFLETLEVVELAAARFRPVAEAKAFRKANQTTVFTAGLLIAAFVSIPIVNLATPLFGMALMVHVHKRLSQRQLAAR